MDLEHVLNGKDERYETVVRKAQDLGYEFDKYMAPMERLFADDDEDYEVHIDPRSMVFFSPNCLNSQMSQGPVEIENDERLNFMSDFVHKEGVKASAHGSSYLLEVKLEERVKDYPRGVEGLVEDADEVIRSLHTIHGESEPGLEEKTEDGLKQT
ncbi:MAG: hypothetical protein ABEJ72_03020 [Candidatus Aenigmatarchaeota archaeon]